MKNKEDLFWNTDLEEIQKSYLSEGKKITDLPIFYDNRVPARDIYISLKRICNLDDYKRY